MWVFELRAWCVTSWKRWKPALAEYLTKVMWKLEAFSVRARWMDFTVNQETLCPAGLLVSWNILTYSYNLKFGIKGRCSSVVLIYSGKIHVIYILMNICAPNKWSEFLRISTGLEILQLSASSHHLINGVSVSFIFVLAFLEQWTIGSVCARLAPPCASPVLRLINMLL